MFESIYKKLRRNIGGLPVNLKKEEEMRSQSEKRTNKSREVDLFIGGEYVESSNQATFEVKNPATQEIIARVSEATEEDVIVHVVLQDKHLKKVLGVRCLLLSGAQN